MGKLYTINDMAKAHGLTQRALRFYEQSGLIKPERIKGQRYYSAEDSVILDRIVRMLRAGFTIKQVSIYLKMDAPSRRDFMAEWLPEMRRQMIADYAARSKAIEILEE